MQFVKVTERELNDRKCKNTMVFCTENETTLNEITNLIKNVWNEEAYGKPRVTIWTGVPAISRKTFIAPGVKKLNFDALAENDIIVETFNQNES